MVSQVWKYLNVKEKTASISLQVLPQLVGCAASTGAVPLMRTQDWVWHSPLLMNLDISKGFHPCEIYIKYSNALKWVWMSKNIINIVLFRVSGGHNTDQDLFLNATFC